MKRVVFLSVLVASTMYATNGDNMIGIGAESRAMGGLGIALPLGTDSAYSNPAWVSDSKGFNFSFGATVFMPKVHAKAGPAQMPNGQGIPASANVKSAADLSLIPSVSITNNITDNLSYGVGMFGVSGMGVDYRNEDPRLANMRTALQYMRFVPSLSYKMDDLHIGVGVTLAYGALSMAAITPDSKGNRAQRSGGLSEDFGVGAQLGLGYRFAKEFTFGAFYQSQINTEYEKLFDFTGDGKYNDLKLSQPAEAGVGLGYEADCGCYKFGIDYKRILWSKADGYDAFGWDDQDVIAVGGSYVVQDGLTLRAGYNYAPSPLDGKKNFSPATIGGASFPGAFVGFFNTLGFPAYTDTHYTLGLAYNVSNTTSVDIAYTYAPEVTETIPSVAQMQLPSYEASNEQSAITMAVKYKF